jgi:predicted ATP-binding protein involved in virulence
LSRTDTERKPIQRQPSVSRSPIQLSRFSVSRLFGRYDHAIQFPHTAEASDVPSVVILHGPNGVGKTTVLRMLDGMMQLDFDMFRVTPFGTASLQFTDE